MSTPHLPYAEAHSGDFMVTAGGYPTWPVRCERDRHCLATIAETCRAELKRVEADPGRTSGSGGLVVGFGAETAEAAKLYAHLTDRSWDVVSDSVWPSSLHPEVVVTTPYRLTNDVLDTLYSSETEGEVPGLICAPDATSLRRQVLVRSAAVRLMPCRDGARVVYSPHLKIDRIASSSAQVYGRHTPSKQLVSTFRGPSALLAIWTHSDGIDGMLKRTFVMCPMDNGVHQVTRGEDAPRCIQEDFCFRREKPIAAAWQSGELLGPDSVASGVFIWDVCTGVTPGDSPIAWPWNPGHRFAQSPSIGALVTTWRVCLTNQLETMVLFHDIGAGTPLGRAVARYNESERAQRFGQRLCLLGDPSLRLAARPENARALEKARARRPLAHLSAATEAVSPSHEHLGEALLERASALDKVGPLAEDALAALRRYRGSATDEATARQREYRDALLRYLLRRGRVFNDWLPLARSHVPAPDTDCACGRPARALLATPFGDPALTRRISTCPICGVVEDVPMSPCMDGVVSFVDASVVIDNPSASHLAGVTIYSHNSSAEEYRWRWPEQGSGPPIREFRLPAWPRGVHRVTVFVITDFAFAMYSTLRSSVSS